MSTRTLKPVRSRQNQLTVIEGSFAPNGSSAPTGAKGNGYTVARTGTGKYVVTLDDGYADILKATAGLQDATLGSAAQVTNVTKNTSPTRSTIEITTFTVSTSTAADLAADAQTRVNFSISLSDSSAKP